jgi:proteasome accessory factor B
MPAKIDLSERLFNLTCALLVSSQGLTKAEIFANVQGYKERYVQGGDNESLSRLFERDKVLLTKVGVAWRSFIPPEDMDDNQEFRYLIANEDFVWPTGTTLSAKQVALMNLAAQVWAKASLSRDANNAIMRIRAMGETADATSLIGIAPRIRTHELSFLPLSTAIETSSRVSFDYQKPEQQVAKVRNVEPWIIQNISGQWLLLGFDLDRQAPRNYLLRRICSEVDIQDFTFEPPSKAEVNAAIAQLDQHRSSSIATIKVPTRSAAWFHFDLKSDQDELDLPFMDIHLLAEELMEFVDHIEVLSPPELAVILKAKLEAVRDFHA